MVWQFQDAQNQFEEVVANALQYGPQIIVQNGREVAVVLPACEHRRTVKPQPNLLDLLLESPLADSGLTNDCAARLASPPQGMGDVVDQAFGNGRFAQQRHLLHHPGRTEQHHPVGVYGEARAVGQHIVDGDKIQPLA